MKNQKGFTLIELLVVVAIIGILSGIAFVSISGARESAYDTQIRSELSQIRSNAEQFYYGSGDGSYHGYDTASGWENIQNEIPSCSVALLNSDASEAVSVGTTDFESYQLNIEGADGPGDEYAQSYAAWAPLCGDRYEDGADEYIIFYCADSEGNAGEYYDDDETMGGIDVGETNCQDIFPHEA